MDERALIARFEAANPLELANLLKNVDADQERALIAYLGKQRYQRIAAAAASVSGQRGSIGAKRGNVVVLPGIMGSELGAVSWWSANAHLA